MAHFRLFVVALLMQLSSVIIAQSPDDSAGSVDSVGSAGPAGSADPECDDFDFLGMLPMKEIMSAVQTAIRSDDETQNLGSYIQTPEFKSIVQRLTEAASSRRLLKFLGGVGLNVGKVVNAVGQHFQSASDTQSNTDTEMESVGAPAPGVNNLAQHLVSLLPTQKMIRCLNFRVNTDPVFKTVMEGVSSPEFRNLVSHVRNSEQFSALQSSLQDRGLQINGLLNQGLNYLRVPPS